MQYLYLFIFVFFILLNVVIGLASGRAKKRRAARGEAAGNDASGNGIEGDVFTKESAPSVGTDVAPEQTGRRAFTESMLRPQTAHNIVETLFEEPKPMIDISRPDEEVELSIEKNLLESEVASRVAERQKEQDEKYQSHGLYSYQDNEASTWDKINGLSPLQRAIVLSELLGPPRALSEGRHSE